MEKVCFVVMPFGGKFDEIYRRIYIPVIRKAGLEPRRADDIYDNRPIIQDIWDAIQNAEVILADVTGRNPNVNYELGLAHGLGKEVIIVTSNLEDVPFDYRHLRCICYNSGGIGWEKDLSENLCRTFRTVLGRLRTPNAADHTRCPGNGIYERVISKTYQHSDGRHYFYRLKELLPLEELKKIGVSSYVADESHWLADWNQERQRFKEGDTVKFRVTRVSGLNNWGHVSNARNVNFDILL
ncbi:MAG: hypothetical protein HFG93_03660 [Dorea sp.]|nr:hypothetical protein [Dorea sp.]